MDWYMWQWDDKIIPLLVVDKHPQSFFTADQVDIKRKEQLSIPAFFRFSRSIYQHIYDIDYSLWYKAVDQTSYCQDIYVDAETAFIELLSSYDTTKKEVFFNLAECINKNMLLAFPNDEATILNSIQLKKRKSDLSAHEITKLELILNQTTSTTIKYCTNILLENKHEAKKLFNTISKDEQNFLLKHPIYNLL